MSQAKCIAKTKLGKACRAGAVLGTQYCSLHGDPERAAELGRLGGRKNRHYIETDPVIIDPPQTPEDVKTILAQTTCDVLAKKLDPRIGLTIAQMCNSLLKAFDVVDVHQRLARLEEQDRLSNT